MAQRHLRLHLLPILMVEFLNRSLIFAAPLIIISIFATRYDPAEGDLVRMSYEKSRRLYSAKAHSQRPYLPIHIDGKKDKSLAIFGDSFIHNSDGPGFWEPLTSSYSIACFRNHDFEGETNPITIALNSQDTLRYLFEDFPDIIIIETVERSFLNRIKDYNRSYKLKLSEKNFSKISLADRLDPLQALHTGGAIIANRIGYSLRNPLEIQTQLVQKRTGKKIPLASRDFLLTCKDDFENRLMEYDLGEIKNNLQELTERFKRVFPNSEVHLLIIPDKLSVYEGFLNEALKKQSVLKCLDWNLPALRINLLDTLLFESEKGVSELYTYSGSHLGSNGAELVAEKLKISLNKFSEAD